MIKLDSGNVLLKPSQRKQMMTWLRRCLRLGKRLGDFVLSITLRKNGRFYEARAAFTPAGSAAATRSFACRSRRHDWPQAIREISRDLTLRIHDQCVRQALNA